MQVEPRFFICEHCKNLVGAIVHNGPKLFCCGKPMTEIVSNTTEGATEKHLPVINYSGQTIIVDVGSTPHPMVDAHLIEWVYLQTNMGGARKVLEANTPPQVSFALYPGEEPVAVYAYCNLHGLWKTVF